MEMGGQGFCVFKNRASISQGVSSRSFGDWKLAGALNAVMLTAL